MVNTVKCSLVVKFPGDQCDRSSFDYDRHKQRVAEPTPWSASKERGLVS